MKKYMYSVCVNGYKSKSKENIHLSYSFRNTKDIQLIWSGGGFCLFFEIGRKYEDACSNYLVEVIEDGIQRAALVHLLRTGKLLSVKSIRVACSEDSSAINIETNLKDFEIYSLCTSLGRTIPESMKKEEVLQKIVSLKKGASSNQNAAINAYLLAKTRKMEYERFISLWTAFNGFYQSLSGATKGNERESINNVLTTYALGKSILTKAERSSGKLNESVIHSIKQYPYDISIKDISVDKKSEEKISRDIREALNRKDVLHDITIYGYVLGELGYYLRCKQFHAEQPLQLFAFSNSEEIKTLHIVNMVLEDFLDNHLADVF